MAGSGDGAGLYEGIFLAKNKQSSASNLNWAKTGEKSSVAIKSITEDGKRALGMRKIREATKDVRTELNTPNGKITISYINDGNKHVVDDIVRGKTDFPLNKLKELPDILSNAEYVKETTDVHKLDENGNRVNRKDTKIKFIYFKTIDENGKPTYWNIATDYWLERYIAKDGTPKWKKKERTYLYSLRRNIKTNPAD